MPKEANQKNLTVLWVDDEILIRQIGKKRIELLGYQAIDAGGGREALEIMETQKVDLVITDIGMPEMNGWKLCDEIRKRYGKSVLIAILSGWGIPDLEEDIKAHQVDYILGKPCEMEQLDELLKTVSGLSN